METSNRDNVIIEYTNTTMLSVEQSVMVAPFTNYTVTIVAFTSAGSGELVVQVALSPEAGKFMLLGPNLLVSSFLPSTTRVFCDKISFIFMIVHKSMLLLHSIQRNPSTVEYSKH